MQTISSKNDKNEISGQNYKIFKLGTKKRFLKYGDQNVIILKIGVSIEHLSRTLFIKELICL
jgi:hypothetical protein